MADTRERGRQMKDTTVGWRGQVRYKTNTHRREDSKLHPVYDWGMAVDINWIRPENQLKNPSLHSGYGKPNWLQ